MSFPLNPAQAAAVRRTDAPMLVLAGAGSGKTRVIAAKVAHLIAGGTDPAKIVAVTFTNKAAREMRERVDRLLAGRARGGDASSVRIQTFHALGLSIVRAEAKAFGLRPGFSVLDPQDLESVVGELVASADRSRIRRAQWAISRWKNALFAPSAAMREADGDDERAAAKAYAHYADALAAYQAVDFDDLIRLPVELFERDATVRARWQARCDHVLVDEVQDTNPAQYRLFRALVGERARFTAVGDDDQAIYGWRGATVENLAQLERDYPGLVVVKLEQNYRSTTRILASANALIANNAKLHEKRLWSDRGHGDAIRVVAARDEEAEAEIVASAISAHRFEHRGRWSDYAVLYRGNHQARAFEAALRSQSIPYEVSGGQSWFDRTEIKDLVAYLRLVANEDDDPAFLRAVAVPKRGVGRTTLAKLAEAATAAHSSLVRAIRDPAFAAAAQARAHETLSAFERLIADLRRRSAREPAGRLIDELLRAIGYEDHLVATFDRREAEAKSASVREFTAWLARKGESDRKTLTELVQAIALITMLEGRDGEGADTVRLSTLHAAKGLEFPHVFLAGLEEGILPHRESIDAGTIDEERRLLYVGLTRAERSLHLSFCRTRTRAGGRVECQPSRFIGELVQDDLRWAGAPLPPDEAAREKAAGAERLKAIRAALAARQGGG
ncbi:MAG: UvrD-helicase domain-containing protein [Burkholderiales bacterium]|nr:UvrD-helicase domain-containing protein [Burkholderiales bacterium]